MIHETHRETMFRCDTETCPEIDWLPPGVDVHDWLERIGGRSDGQVHFCACCARVKEAA